MYMYIGAYVTLSVTTMITADASQRLHKIKIPRMLRVHVHVYVMMYMYMLTQWVEWVV